MTEQHSSIDATDVRGDVDAANQDAPPATDGTPDPAGADQLGDAGKKALDAMKEREKAARAAAREAQAEVERLRSEMAAANQTAEERAREEARREARAEADARANERILKAEIRAAATAKLTDPADALRFLDLSQFDVSNDGDVDAALITEAINDLLAARPYLGRQAAQPDRPTLRPDPAQGARSQPDKSDDDRAYEDIYGPSNRK